LIYSDKSKLDKFNYDRFKLDIVCVNAAFEIGEYWDKHVQIDVVGLRDDHWTDIGRRCFLRKKPTAKLTKNPGVVWYGLEDLYESSG
jgi:hypothetical protein